jgi:hypothetical protein
MTEPTKKLKVNLFFAWYDFWVGFYYDRKQKVLYICPLPCVVIKLCWQYFHLCDGEGVVKEYTLLEEGKMNKGGLGTPPTAPRPGPPKPRPPKMKKLKNAFGLYFKEEK